jgi:hypothetical protein
MKLAPRTGRRLLSRLALATLLAALLSCGGKTPSQPSPPSPQTPTVPSCSVRVWGCATSGYGSIAYSASTGASGVSYNWGTRAEADSSAIGYCGKSDCTVVAWFQNSCGALATAPTGQMATGTATSGDTAQALALASCLTR